MATTCKSCGAGVLWAKTPAGRSIPIDAHDPIEVPADVVEWPRGLFVLDREKKPPVAVPATEVQYRGHDGPFFKTHFATCPDADRHRRGYG